MRGRLEMFAIYPLAPRETNDSKLPTPTHPPPSNSVGILPSPEDIHETFLSEVRWCASMFETSHWKAFLRGTFPSSV
ncbi:hypothetical protein CEXT_318661 [Caerostris extrusa]|uniref:Uncharacterized protein n=1 Tax=Caerostris extrusa TaxID=172846 RepID=A0AAV4TVF1_CAEEX|nr:hypothetical protein CEXT_318661 [Caerostris extrusa]